MMHPGTTAFPGATPGREQWDKIFELASTICHICQQETPSAFPLHQISSFVHQLDHEVSFLRSLLPYSDGYTSYAPPFNVPAPQSQLNTYPPAPIQGPLPMSTPPTTHDGSPALAPSVGGYFPAQRPGFPPMAFRTRSESPVAVLGDGLHSRGSPHPSLSHSTAALRSSDPPFWNGYTPEPEETPGGHDFPHFRLTSGAFALTTGPPLSEDLRREGNITLEETPPRKRKRTHVAGRACSICHEENTPEWRRGPEGNHTLCNACGLNYAKKMKAERTNLERMGRRKHSIDAILNTKKHQLTDIIQAERRRKRTTFSSFPVAEGSSPLDSIHPSVVSAMLPREEASPSRPSSQAPSSRGDITSSPPSSHLTTNGSSNGRHSPPVDE